MSDWINWLDGDRPPPPDALVEVRSRNYVRRGGRAVLFDWQGGDIICYRVLNQHLIDAARLEGIRLGLEAARRHAEAITALQSGRLVAIPPLDPETIARDAADKETAR